MSSPTEADLFQGINHFAQRAVWLHTQLYAGCGILLLAGLLVAAWFVARHDGAAKMAALATMADTRLRPLATDVSAAREV